MNWTKLTQPLQCKTHNYPHICQLKVNHASTNIMPIHCLSDDVCVSNQGTSNPCPPTTCLHGWGFHITTLIRSSRGNGHTNTRPIRVRSPTYLKEQILYWSANYSQDAIIFKTRPGVYPRWLWSIKYQSATHPPIHDQSSPIYSQSIRTLRSELKELAL